MSCCFGLGKEQVEETEDSVPTPHVKTEGNATEDERWIELVEKDGAIVPLLHRFSEARVEALKEAGVEILINEAAAGEVGRSYVVYIKQYSEAEHDEIGAGGFHRGYTLKSFFERFNELLPLVRAESVEMFLPFMDADTQAIFS